MKRIQSSEPALNTKMPPDLLFLRHMVCTESFLPIGGTLFDEKIRHRAALFGFGLQNVKILQILHSQEVLQRTIVDFPAFLETGLAQNIGVLCTYNPSADEVGGFEVFLYEAVQHFKYLRSKLKNQKPIVVDFHFKAYSWCHSHADLIWLDGTFN